MKTFLTFMGVIGLVVCIGGSLGWSQDQVILGGVAPLSAPGAAESGAEMKIAMEMAVSEIGQILGKPIKLQVEDTRGLPEEGTAAMNRLADAGAAGVVGEFHSAVANAEIEVANQRKLPLIIAEAWADVITAKHYPYVFRIAPANSLFYTKVSDWVKAIGAQNVVAIVENTDWGLGIDTVFKETLHDQKNIDGDPVQYTSIVAERTVTDFTPQLLRYKSMSPRPDLVMDIFTGTGEYLIVKQTGELGLAPNRETLVFAVGTSALYPEYWETVGKYGVFSITKTGYHPLLGVTPAIKKFNAEFEAKTGKTPTFAAMEAYDSIHVLAQAIEQAGSTASDAIVAALEKIKYDGVLGTIYFSADKKPDYMYHQWPGAKAVIIQYTAEGQKYTDAELLWPAALMP
ncbi:MAG: ABC transporter substrate-binding protein [Desulfobacterales bacterium]|nr:MAG: ABC transporter substrate-binding protein [Desulfobacterales bacterium]